MGSENNKENSKGYDSSRTIPANPPASYGWIGSTVNMRRGPVSSCACTRTMPSPPPTRCTVASKSPGPTRATSTVCPSRSVQAATHASTRAHPGGWAAHHPLAREPQLTRTSPRRPGQAAGGRLQPSTGWDDKGADEGVSSLAGPPLNALLACAELAETVSTASRGVAHL
jgi:hypothetical protein